jgi:lysophospholipase L1-like esterase
MGRVERARGGRLRFGYPGVTLRLRVEGSSLAMRAGSSTANSRLGLIVDGGPPRVIRLPAGEARVPLADGMTAGVHSLELFHRTETWQGIVTVAGFELGPGARLLPPDRPPQRRLLFIGDSVTCGEGTDRPADGAMKDAASTSNGYLSYGMVLGRTLDAQVHLVCYGGRGLIRDWRGKTNVANAPTFFDLAIAADSRGARVPWDHAGYVPDVVVVSLGTNDFNLALGQLPAREEYVTAYLAFVRAIRGRYPRARVFLTEGAIVDDEEDPTRPRKTVLAGYLAETVRRLGDENVRVVPATHYPGDAYNPHPTAAQHLEMARDLEPVVRRAMGWNAPDGDASLTRAAPGPH